MLATSDPVAPGETAVLFVLLPADPRFDLKPSAVWMDPPTAAAFAAPLRIDVLTAGETVDVCGVLAPSLRLVVQNRSAEAVPFRAEIQLGPDLSRMEHHLGNIIESTWRDGRDHPERALFDANDARTLGPGAAGRVWFKAG